MQLDKKEIARKANELKNRIERHRSVVLALAMFSFGFIAMLGMVASPVAATPAEDIANFTTYVGTSSTGVLGVFYQIIGVFSIYPLNIVVVVGLLGLVFRKIKKSMPK